MAGNKRIVFILIIGLGFLLSLAFAVLHESSEPPVFLDDFEKYSGSRDIQKAYIVWEDGAFLQVAIAENSGHSGKQALKIEMVSPNPENQSVNGSIYHILPGSERDWSQATQMRFWVKNSNENPLLLSFNFKEAFNEYWAVSSSGLFFLESDEHTLLQQEIQFGNLPIPADYQGHVIIPFYSCSVPDWNTARGDGVMNLQRIESFAIAVNIGNDYPGSFLLDDFEVRASTLVPTLEIQGERTIQVPSSGEHREHYSALLVNPINNTKKEIEPDWSIRQPINPTLDMDDQGYLTVPAGFSEENITIAAAHPLEDQIISNLFTITLSGGEIRSPEPVAGSVTEKPDQTEDAVYNQSSKPLENWATENRVFFVIISVGAILLILSLLSYFQQRLK